MLDSAATPVATESDVLIVGSSIASARSIEALRRLKFEGSITVLTNENVPFYNRPPLTKDYMTGDCTAEDLLLLDADACRALDVRVLTDSTAEVLDLKAQTVETAGGTHHYKNLVLATGARARRLPAFAQQQNVFYLRNLAEAGRLREAFGRAKSVVIVGFGFLGCELASSARHLGLDVTIIDADLKPYAQFGRHFSDALTSMHKANGVHLILGTTVSAVNSTERQVSTIDLSNGERLKADIYIVAVGAVPNTDWLKGSGLTIDDGVICDSTLEAAPRVHAAGDIARWPDPSSGAMTRVEHWTNAVDHAATIAHNIVNPRQKKTHTATPYFWSNQFSCSIQYLGFLGNHSEYRWFQSDSGSIAGVFGKERRVRGVIGINAANVVVRSRALIASGRPWDIGLAEIAGIAERYGYKEI